VSSSRIGCHIDGVAANMFAYADDIVLLAYAWAALKVLSCELVDVVKILD